MRESKKLSFCRACRATEWDSQEGRHYTIDVATRDPASRPRVQEAKVLVVTTGTAFKAVDHWHREIAEHIGASCFLCMKKGNKHLTPVRLSGCYDSGPVPCHLCWRWNQSPGRDSKLVQRLRSELMRQPIGLRAGQKSRTSSHQRSTHESHGPLAGPRCGGCLVPHRSSQYWWCFCPMVQGQPLCPRRGTTGSLVSERSWPCGHTRRH